MNRFVKSLLRILICVPVEGAGHNDLIGILGLCEYKKFLLGVAGWSLPKKMMADKRSAQCLQADA